MGTLGNSYILLSPYCYSIHMIWYTIPKCTLQYTKTIHYIFYAFGFPTVLEKQENGDIYLGCKIWSVDTKSISDNFKFCQLISSKYKKKGVLRNKLKPTSYYFWFLRWIYWTSFVAITNSSKRDTKKASVAITNSSKRDIKRASAIFAFVK